MKSYHFKDLIQTFIETICYFKVRSSHQRCSVRKGVLRNFTKFTGKHLSQSLFDTVFTEHLRTTASVKCSLSKTKVKVAWTLCLHCRHSLICARHLPLFLELFLKYLKVHLKCKITLKDLKITRYLTNSYLST